MCFHFYQHLSKCLQTNLMWYIFIKTNHVCSTQPIILPRSIMWIPEISVTIVKKSKMPQWICNLESWTSSIKSGHKFVFYIICIILMIFMFLILLRKSLVSLIYNCPSCITSLKWCFKNSEIFPVSALQFDITVLLAASNNLLGISESKCILWN